MLAARTHTRSRPLTRAHTHTQTHTDTHTAQACWDSPFRTWQEDIFYSYPCIPVT